MKEKRPQQSDTLSEQARRFRLLRLDGASGVTRTPDLLITNQLLYRLSYTSKSCGWCHKQVLLYHMLFRASTPIHTSYRNIRSVWILRLVILQVFMQYYFVSFVCLTRFLSNFPLPKQKKHRNFKRDFVKSFRFGRYFLFFSPSARSPLNRHNSICHHSFYKELFTFSTRFSTFLFPCAAAI